MTSNSDINYIKETLGKFRYVGIGVNSSISKEEAEDIPKEIGIYLTDLNNVCETLLGDKFNMIEEERLIRFIGNKKDIIMLRGEDDSWSVEVLRGDSVRVKSYYRKEVNLNDRLYRKDSKCYSL